MRIHQLLAGASPGDAITQYSLEIREILREQNIESFIYAPTNPFVSESAAIFPLQELSLNIKSNDSVWCHFSIGSEISELYRTMPGRKILFYHNITPAEYYLPFSDGMASLLRDGRGDLRTLAPVTDCAVADSLYNRKELDEAGFRNTRVIPLTVARTFNSVKSDQSIIKNMSGSCVNILFVGRVVPNKRFDDLINVFSVYHDTVNHNSRLVLAGQYEDLYSYYEKLKKKCMDLQISGKVIFTGRLKPEALRAYYETASVFLCLSEHEGFCLPLIESMHFELPVLALARTAVPETMGESGVLVNKLDYRMIAEIINLAVTNREIRKEITESQKKRLEYFSSDRFKKNIAELAAGGI